MKHLGDITKINGAEIPIVDCICGGSPCQDLSVAGKRAGLDGERSGLFMDQIRVVKEMREHDRSANQRTGQFVRPRFMVWENVPGALSSNKGEDFRCVLEETARIAKESAVIPGPPRGGWHYSGAIMGDGWSIAWRIHDAQFWGVPQRRKRIALVADFGGLSAPEILFVRKGLSGDSEESGEARKGAAAHAQGGTGKAISFQERAGKPGGGKGILIQDERIGALSTLNNQSVCYGFNRERCGAVIMDNAMPTLQAAAGESGNNQPMVCLNDQQQAVVYGISSYDSNAMKSDNPNSGIYEAETSRTLDLNGGNPACNQGGMVVVCLEGNGSRPSHKGDGYAESDTMYTLNSTEHHAVCIENHPADSRVKISEDGMVQTLSSRMGTGGGNVPMVMEEKCYSIDEKMGNTYIHEDQGNTLGAMDYKQPQAVCKTYQDVTGTLDCGIAKGTGNQLANQNMFVANISVVRRLTPLECERLQGFPDGWTDIGEWTDSKGKMRKCSDSARYKALGNSIAIPFWFYLLRRISAQYERPATLGSLFDGIGGFPLCWERCNGPGTAIWASEIEEFPIAVTKRHFPEKEETT